MARFRGSIPWSLRRTACGRCAGVFGANVLEGDGLRLGEGEPRRPSAGPTLTMAAWIGHLTDGPGRPGLSGGAEHRRLDMVDPIGRPRTRSADPRRFTRPDSPQGVEPSANPTLTSAASKPTDALASSQQGTDALASSQQALASSQRGTDALASSQRQAEARADTPYRPRSEAARAHARAMHAMSGGWHRQRADDAYHHLAAADELRQAENVRTHGQHTEASQRPDERLHVGQLRPELDRITRLEQREAAASAQGEAGATNLAGLTSQRKVVEGQLYGHRFAAGAHARPPSANRELAPGFERTFEAMTPELRDAALKEMSPEKRRELGYRYSNEHREIDAQLNDLQAAAADENPQVQAARVDVAAKEKTAQAAEEAYRSEWRRIREGEEQKLRYRIFGNLFGHPNDPANAQTADLRKVRDAADSDLRAAKNTERELAKSASLSEAQVAERADLLARQDELRALRERINLGPASNADVDRWLEQTTEQRNLALARGLPVDQTRSMARYLRQRRHELAPSPGAEPLEAAPRAELEKVDSALHRLENAHVAPHLYALQTQSEEALAVARGRKSYGEVRDVAGDLGRLRALSPADHLHQWSVWEREHVQASEQAALRKEWDAHMAAHPEDKAGVDAELREAKEKFLTGLPSDKRADFEKNFELGMQFERSDDGSLGYRAGFEPTDALKAQQLRQSLAINHHYHQGGMEIDREYRRRDFWRPRTAQDAMAFRETVGDARPDELMSKSSSGGLQSTGDEMLFIPTGTLMNGARGLFGKMTFRGIAQQGAKEVGKNILWSGAINTAADLTAAHLGDRAGAAVPYIAIAASLLTGRVRSSRGGGQAPPTQPKPASNPTGPGFRPTRSQLKPQMDTKPKGSVMDTLFPPSRLNDPSRLRSLTHPRPKLDPGGGPLSLGGGPLPSGGLPTAPLGSPAGLATKPAPVRTRPAFTPAPSVPSPKPLAPAAPTPPTPALRTPFAPSGMAATLFPRHRPEDRPEMFPDPEKKPQAFPNPEDRPADLLPLERRFQRLDVRPSEMPGPDRAPALTPSRPPLHVTPPGDRPETTPPGDRPEPEAPLRRFDPRDPDPVVPHGPQQPLPGDRPDIYESPTAGHDAQIQRTYDSSAPLQKLRDDLDDEHARMLDAWVKDKGEADAVLRALRRDNPTLETKHLEQQLQAFMAARPTPAATLQSVQASASEGKREPKKLTPFEVENWNESKSQVDLERLLDDPSAHFRRAQYPGTNNPISEPGYKDGQPLEKGRLDRGGLRKGASYPDVYGTDTQTQAEVLMELKKIKKWDTVKSFFERISERDRLLGQMGAWHQNLPPGGQRYLVFDLRQSADTDVESAVKSLGEVLQKNLPGGDWREVVHGVRFITGGINDPKLSDVYDIP